MRVYLGGLWAGVSAVELDRLVRESLRGPWYKLHLPRGHLTSCQLFEVQGTSSRPREYCALIRVEPHRLGWEVVQRLSGTVLHGRTLSAHRWFSRKGLSDRRANSINDELQAAPQGDRRIRPDRRRDLPLRRLSVAQVESVGGFQRSYGG